MKSFREYLTEGGNVQIGDEFADRIDLREIPRSDITPKLMDGLEAINKEFEKKFGIPIWRDELFQNKSFLSGSAFHFFDEAIEDKEFKTAKPTVGDIDTQVDKNMKDQLEIFLNKFSGSAGPLKYIGFKKSAGQFISLWQVEEFGINVQLDLELVDFFEGRPTEWSQFSHSSSWEDIKEGIKGVFHKYALRALSTKDIKDIVLLTGKTDKPKKIRSTELAFSVEKGLRYKMEPVYDEDGKQKTQDGLRVFRELKPKDSTYITDLTQIFKIFFDDKPTSRELKKFASFVGVLEMVAEKWPKSDQKNFLKGFANTLWGKGAQALVRGGAEEDYKFKMTAYYKALDILDAKEDNEVKQWRNQYYQNY